MPALHRRAARFSTPSTAIRTPRSTTRSRAVTSRSPAGCSGRSRRRSSPRVTGHGSASPWTSLRESELARPSWAGAGGRGPSLAADRRRRAQGWSEAADELLAAEPGEWSGPAALVRACLAHEGVARLEADAEHACDRMPLDGAGHCLALLLSGVAHHLGGGRATARERLGDAVCRSADAYPVLNGLVHAQLALLAIDAATGARRRARGRRLRRARRRPAPVAAHALGLAVFAVAAAQRAMSPKSATTPRTQAACWPR